MIDEEKIRKLKDLIDSSKNIVVISGAGISTPSGIPDIRGVNGAANNINLIKKYGTKDEAGELVTDDKGNCTIPPEVLNKFQEEFMELASSEVELNVNPISLDSLEEIDFTPSEMSALEAFLDVGE